jgi:hypothetical protein
MSCNKGSYCEEDNTWSPKCGSLEADYWAPYSGPPYFENYSRDCNSYNQTAGYGCGCAYNSGGCDRCSPYNKLGPNHEKKEGYYASGNTSWTTGNNVTPYNHNLKYNYTKWKSPPTRLKEKYGGCCKPTPYLRANQVWGGQKPYQS